jgi:glucose/arabinose dehydrogenase
MQRAIRAAVVVALGASTLVGTAGRAAAASKPVVKLTRVSTVSGTTALAVRRDDPALYVARQGGTVRAIREHRLVTEPVLDISGSVSSGGERGLLGLVFSLDGSHVYVDYTDRSGNIQIDEYGMSGDRADPTSRRPILTIPHPLYSNHNGGQIAFGPDRMLYIGVGDGGGADDEGPGHLPGGNAQSRSVLLGKLLRIDPAPTGAAAYSIPPDNPFVGVPGTRPEIWSYGLRNPWRFAFDATTHDLWIGDVGQDQWEEVDHVTASHGNGRGANFGWNRLEGTHPFRGDPPPDAVAPVFEYSHDDGCSVIGGYVYRGTKIHPLAGSYVFSDNCKGDLRALRAGAPSKSTGLGITSEQVSSLGEGADGTLYVLSQSHGVFRVDPR